MTPLPSFEDAIAAALHGYVTKPSPKVVLRSTAPKKRGRPRGGGLVPPPGLKPARKACPKCGERLIGDNVQWLKGKTGKPWAACRPCRTALTRASQERARVIAKTGKCVKGHDLAGSNLRARSNGYMGCHLCQLEHQRESAARRNGSRMMPLHKHLLRALITIYETKGRTISQSDFAAELDIDPNSAHVFAGRLRRPGLIVTHQGQGREVIHELTKDGVILIEAWLDFLDKIGGVAPKIGWG